MTLANMEPESRDASSLAFFSNNPIFSKLRDTCRSYNARRASLNLPNPGTVENVAKEVQHDVFFNHLAFTGLKADLSKTCSATPLFQVSHQLAMGSQQMAPYTYAALYGSPKIFLQGNIDTDFSMSGRFNYKFSPSFVAKSNIQLAPGQAMVAFDHEYTGADFSATLKSLNPSLISGGLTGIFMASYLQSVTPKLAIGLEAMYQRAAMTYGPDVVIRYAGRYKSDNWIASAQLLAQGGFQASYWRRLAEKVEAGVDVNLHFVGLGGPASGLMGPLTNEGRTTLGAKYDFRASSFRAQIDSTGRLGCLLEKRVAPPVQVTFSGEIDHAKNSAKLGLSVSIESMDEAVMEEQEKIGSSPQSSIPF